MQSPLFVLARFITQGLEGDRRFYRVSGFRKYTLRFKNEVDARIFSVSVSESAITLNSVWIEKYEIRLTLVVESIDVHSDKVVVSEDVVSTSNCCPDLRPILRGFERNVQILRVKTDHHFGRIARLDIVTRLRLQKFSKHGSIAPNGIVEISIYHRRCIESRNACRSILADVSRIR